jgi:hypothetical protein
MGRPSGESPRRVWTRSASPRSGPAREAGERALVRVVYHYGARAEFVALASRAPEETLE